MEHLTTKQLADRWHRKPQTIRIHRQKGKGPKYIRLGDSDRARVLYRLSDVIEYEEQHLFDHTDAEAAAETVAE